MYQWIVITFFVYENVEIDCQPDKTVKSLLFTILQNINLNIQSNKKDSSSDNNTINKNESNVKNKDDPLMEYIQSHREITQDDINDAPLLLLEEDPNGNIFNKKQIKITIQIYSSTIYWVEIYFYF